jgi:hypothetical protein
MHMTQPFILLIVLYLPYMFQTHEEFFLIHVLKLNLQTT